MCRSYKSVRYRFRCTEVTEKVGRGTDVPNRPKCPVPVIADVYTGVTSVRTVPNTLGQLPWLSQIEAEREDDTLP